MARNGYDPMASLDKLINRTYPAAPVMMHTLPSRRPGRPKLPMMAGTMEKIIRGRSSFMRCYGRSQPAAVGGLGGLLFVNVVS